MPHTQAGPAELSGRGGELQQDHCRPVAESCEAALDRYQSYVVRRPSSSEILGSHPIALSRELSSHFRNMPSGLELSNTTAPL